MSLVTTQPVTPTSSATDAWSLEGVSFASPRDSAGVRGDSWVDRRRNAGPGESPMDTLTRLPALVVLERLPVPSLAIARDGIILFANTAFAEMMGYRQDTLAGSALPQIFRAMPAALCALAGVDALANLVVQLQHCEGWTVRASMSKSVLMRCDDPVVLVTFQNLTERLWMDERCVSGA